MILGSDIGVHTPNVLGVITQEDFDEMTSFADRFFWARHKANIGAPTIAAKTGCSQGLIVNIEKKDAESSTYNDKFAKLFGVSAEWLRTGADPQPEGFNPATAAKMRKGGAKPGGKVLNLDDHRAPRWAGGASDEAVEPSEEDRANTLQRRIFNDFQDYAKLAGSERALGLVEVLTRMAALVKPVEKPERDRQ